MKHIAFCFLAFFTISVSFTQTTINGLITDGDNTLPQINVYIKNTKTGTTSDDFGRFALEGEKGETLVISHIGFQTQKILIRNQKNLSIALDGNSLDEVVVTEQRINRCTRRISCYGTIWSKDYDIEETETNKVATPNPSDALPFSMFPNPSSTGIFLLQLSDIHQNVQLFVSAMSGQQLQVINYTSIGNSINLDLSSYPTGMYLIHIVADGKRLPTQKALRK